MGFEEFFDQDNRRDRQSQYRQFGNDNNTQSSPANNQLDELKQQFLNKLQVNPKLKGMLIAAAIILLVIIVVAIILLMPLIMKLLGFIAENGIQGVLDTIWNGAK